MPAVALHTEVAIHTGGKAGADAHHQRRISDFCSDIFLGNDGIHQHSRFQLFGLFIFGVNENGDLPFPDDAAGIRSIFGQAGRDPCHRCGAIVHRTGKGHRAAHRGGLFDIGADDLEPAAVQPAGNAGGEIPRAFNGDQHILSSYRFQTSYSPGRRCRAAVTTRSTPFCNKRVAKAAISSGRADPPG